MLRRVLRRAAEIAPPRGWLIVGVVWALAMVINSFRWHYGPDARFYLAWAYKLGGVPEAEAGRLTYEFFTQFEWFAPYCWYGCDMAPELTYDWLYRGGEGGLHVQRLVYPLLSAPFVRLFGPPGLLVVPFIAYAVSVVLVMVLARRLFGSQRWAVAAGVAYLLPVSMAKFALYSYTEALAMCLVAACLLVLPLTGPSPRLRRDLIAFGALLVLFAFTRQFHYALVLGVLVAWLGVSVAQRRLRNDWLPFVAVAVGTTAVVALIQKQMSPGYSLLEGFLNASRAGTVDGIPGVLPTVIKGMIGGELEVAAQDFGLVLVVALAAVGLVRFWRTPLALVTVGMLVGTFGLEFITALPSDNRYWALSVPMFAVLAVMTLRWLFESSAFAEADEAPATPGPSGAPRVPQQGRVTESTGGGYEPATKA